MTGSIPADAYPKSLRDIAIQVDELIQDKVIRKRFVDAVKEWEVSPETGSEIRRLPTRALTDTEKLAVLAAIHDAVSEGVDEIDPWRPY